MAFLRFGLPADASEFVEDRLVTELHAACELLGQEPLRNKTEARMAVFEFIEGWYGPIGDTRPWAIDPRVHSSVSASHGNTIVCPHWSIHN